MRKLYTALVLVDVLSSSSSQLQRNTAHTSDKTPDISLSGYAIWKGHWLEGPKPHLSFSDTHTGHLISTIRVLCAALCHVGGRVHSSRIAADHVSY